MAKDKSPPAQPAKPLTEQECINRLQKARAMLMLDFPFYGSLAHALEDEILKTDVFFRPIGDDMIVVQKATACTDGRKIYWSPSFISELSNGELIFILMHECNHPLLGHLWRMKGKDQYLANIACDLPNNYLLKKCIESTDGDRLRLPEGVIYPGSRNLDEMLKNLGFELTFREEDGSAEAFYAGLKRKEQIKTPDGQAEEEGQGKGQGGQGDEGGQGQQDQPQNASQEEESKFSPDPLKTGGFITPKTEEQARELEQEWKVKVAQAAAIAKGIGTLPGALQAVIDNLLNPQIPWYRKLEEFVEKSARNDYNWQRPNKNFIRHNIVLPGLISDEIPHIVVGWDTSGSMWDKSTQITLASELSGILEPFDSTVHVLYTDADIAEIQELTRSDLPLKPKDLKITGGGGTDFRPVFRWISEQDFVPSCCIYITDGQGTFPESEPDYPVLWVVTEKTKVPWGERLQIKVEG